MSKDVRSYAPLNPRYAKCLGPPVPTTPGAGAFGAAGRAFAWGRVEGFIRSLPLAPTHPRDKARSPRTTHPKACPRHAWGTGGTSTMSAMFSACVPRERCAGFTQALLSQLCITQPFGDAPWWSA
jgi:hypothetical protein